MIRWRAAMETALYGTRGFYLRPQNPPAAHFRTSALASPVFARALPHLLERVDEAIGHPDTLDLVDVGAGRGELLSATLAAAGPSLRERLRPVAVERGDVAGPGWRATLPGSVTGLLVATEWLDNVPVDVAEVDRGGVVRYVLVDPATGDETLGDPVTGADADWLARWWPLAAPGTRAEIGRTRDDAWAGAVAAVRRGAALAVDYGHLSGSRPPFGTLTGFRAGREVPPVPDGSCDLTAHVALDAVASAGAALTLRRAPSAGASPAQLVTQREALPALGVTGTRPPLALAGTDPAAYLRALADASAAGELTDPGGLGAHHWLLQPVACTVHLGP